MHTILRLPEIKKRTGLSRSAIYLCISQDTFPKPVTLGGRAMGWSEAEIQECYSGRLQQAVRPRRESVGVGSYPLGMTLRLYHAKTPPEL